MLIITKNNEPKSLTEYRKSTSITYKDMDADVKTDLKASLLEEQGYLCCYCNKRIGFENMKVEHFKCQSNYPHLELSYDNLFAACDGGEGSPKHMQTCDTKKGNEEVKLNPSSSNIINSIKYENSGRIYSLDQEIDNDINTNLNLNNQIMIRNRRSVVDALILHMNKKCGKKAWTKGNIDGMISKIKEKNNKKYKEYAGVMIYFLQRQLLKR